MRRALGALVLAAATALGHASCSVDALDLSGKQCPCEEGWTCDEASGICPRGGSDAGLGGAGGGGGAGGCLSAQKVCNGACVSTSSTTTGCASTSCDPCPSFANAVAACSSGDCASSCSPGFGDCDSLVGNGCEEPLTSSAHCGACNRACALDNATGTSCVSGACAPSCSSGFADCTSPSAADDGCETNTTSTATRCGSCGNACPGGQGCTASLCHCNANAQCQGANGLQEFSCILSTGVCACAGNSCVHGERCIKSGNASVCSCNGGAACAAGHTCCQSPAGCFELMTDAGNCGACGRACPSGQACVAGACQAS